MRERESPLKTLRRFGSTSDNPLVLDGAGRVQLGPRDTLQILPSGEILRTGPPSLIPQDIPRIRLRPIPGPVLTPAQATERNRAVSARRRARQDENRRPLPPPVRRLSIIPYVEVVARRAGKRARRDKALDPEDLYLTEARPGPQGSPHSDLECGICFSIKSHPAVRSFREFSEECFSTEECDARSLGVMPDVASLEGSQGVEPSSSSNPSGAAGAGGDEERDGDQNSDVSRAAEAEQTKKRSDGGKAKKGKKKKAVAPPGSPKRTRAQGRKDDAVGGDDDDEQEDEQQHTVEKEKTRPRPRPLTRLVRPEDDTSAHGPLLENIARPAVAPAAQTPHPPLVRPEDDASAHGPLLEDITRPAVAPAAQTPHPPLVRPEDDASAHGPLRENIARPAVAPAAQAPHPPLVRPEDDASAHGPLRENIARPGAEGEESGDEVLWPDEDRGRWYPDLRGAVSAFGRLAAWGGDEWVECVRRLIVSERAWGFRAAGLLGAMKSRQGRPSEVSKFMTYARKWEVEMDAEAVGPREREDSFAHGWWVWWELLQPKGRRDGEGGLLAAADVDVAEWEVLAKSHGRNGFLLVVACLFWWGSAAAEEGDAALREEWGIAVRDVSAVLGEIVKDVGAMMKSLGDAEKASKKAAKERKKVAEGAAEEESAGRRPRTRGEKRSLDNEKENEKEDGRKKKRRS
ncbi:hypothetical protein C8R47DRAFT_1084772 [Mycena vitilis]|nr:hypothetical protein C8R47DRAFT_1084772 [Mycena vitilis]